jgi:5-(carboxyamino)imidazole ribonucleotide synthase
MIATRPVDSSLIAVLGGGQLGRMLAQAGLPLGLRFRFLDPSPDATAAAFGELTVGSLGDPEAIRSVALDAAVVTYEWEGVPADGVKSAATDAPVLPPLGALALSQDRLDEKQAFARLGIGVPKFVAVDDRASLDRAVESLGLPAVLKTRRGGYDGKGQRVLTDAADLDGAWEALGDTPLILEAHVPFRRELSVLSARGLDGDTRCWPLVENLHAHGILRVSRAPAHDAGPELQAAGEAIATKLLDDLNYVGVLAVELFDCDGTLLANEIAPRVHNSGHWTIEGAETSQFTQHLLAILGRPLVATSPLGHCAMVNCIGTMPDPVAVLAIEGANLHDYEKQPRENRKLGHVTLVAPTPAELDIRLAELERAAPELFEY